jgi:hypothetical protein
MGIYKANLRGKSRVVGTMNALVFLALAIGGLGILLVALSYRGR